MTGNPSDPTIICPNCSHSIRLTESLAGPLLAATRAQYEAKMAGLRAGIERQTAELAAARDQLEAELAVRVAAERQKLEDAAQKGAAARIAEAVAAKDRELAASAARERENATKLEVAQAAQADALRKAREFEDAKRELDLTVEKKVGAELEAVRVRAKSEAEEALRLGIVERDTRIGAMQRQIEELRRKAEQGSQQLQGEVLELELEAELRARFPLDTVEPVPQGQSGADVIQRVAGPAGGPSGTLLWESKRTKAWSDGWLPKLREDQRSLGADVAILVTRTLPKDVERFAPIDGVWVTDWPSAFPLVVALRQSLIELTAARILQEGQGTKMEAVYAYLTGPRFRHRIEAIVERFGEMTADLERERKAMTRLWAKREAQIQAVIGSTVGMYGDLQGIAGRAMGEIDGLELPLLEEGDGP